MRKGLAPVPSGPVPSGPDPSGRRDAAVTRTGVDGGGAHDAVLFLDIETVPDVELLPPEWPADRFPKPAWHRIVAISFVVAELGREPGGRESYAVVACRSGGEAIMEEGRLLTAFWRFFGARRYRVVTWNGRAFDLPTILARSLMHGVDASAWFRRGDRWNGYRHRYASDWHVDLMDAMSDHGAAARLTLEEAAATIGLPGKLGEHGSRVAAMMAAGEVERVRAYCETDTLNLAVLYLRWAYMTGRTDAGSHDRAILGLMGYLAGEREARPHLGRFLDAWRASTAARPPLLAPEAARDAPT